MSLKRSLLRSGIRTKFRAELLGFLGYCYLCFVGLTSRILWINRGQRERLEKELQGFIYAFWHGRQAFLTYLHRQDRVSALMSQSPDGEIIAQVAERFGLRAIRGSSSKGGATALAALEEEVQAGGRVGFTPDGPRGPYHAIQRGVLILAQKTGRPIVPVAYGARRRLVFKGWDEFVVPLPFNRIAMVYGNPLYVRPGDDLEEKAIVLASALDAVASQADGAILPPHPPLSLRGERVWVRVAKKLVKCL